MMIVFRPINENLAFRISGRSYISNLTEKFSPGPGFEPGSPALRDGAIITKLPKRSKLKRGEF